MKQEEKSYAEVAVDKARAEVDTNLSMQRLTASLQDFKMFKENPAWIDIIGFVREKLASYRRRLELESDIAQVMSLQSAIKELCGLIELPDYIISAFADIKAEEADDAKVEQVIKTQDRGGILNGTAN